MSVVIKSGLLGSCGTDVKKRKKVKKCVITPTARVRSVNGHELFSDGAFQGQVKSERWSFLFSLLSMSIKRNDTASLSPILSLSLKPFSITVFPTF